MICPVCSEPVTGLRTEPIDVTIGPTPYGPPPDLWRHFIPGPQTFEPCGHSVPPAPRGDK